MADTKPQIEPRFPSPALRLTEIRVENYKSLDRLELELPPPSTPDQLDAFVLGSKNGVGKSSILECCALSALSAFFPKLLRNADQHRSRIQDAPYDHLVRAGSLEASISAQITTSGSSSEAKVFLYPQALLFVVKEELAKHFGRSSIGNSLFSEETLFDSLLGMNSEPVLMPPVLFFHSYRKVLEGRSSLGAMVDPSFSRERRVSGDASPISLFKVVMLQALMAKSGLFEGIAARDDDQPIDKLRGLLRDFAGGTVDKLRPGRDGTVELRVAPVSGGPSYSFDGLSSGQKEIIATLFLIWFATQDQPSIVLIDEPELHLNAEWQRLFVHKLAELAPKNQYILATHSEEIFGSVTADRRLMLRQS